MGGYAADTGRGIALFIDEMQDLRPEDVSALCAACHEMGQAGLPVIVVGQACRTCRQCCRRRSRTRRGFATHASTASTRSPWNWRCPPRPREDAEWSPDALSAMYAVTGGYPYFVQAYGKAVWDRAPRSPITAEDVTVGAPEAEAELAVGFFGSRYERATPAEREYLRAMAEASYPRSEGAPDGADAAYTSVLEIELDSVPTAEVARILGKKPQSLPARDALLKKG